MTEYGSYYTPAAPTPTPAPPTPAERPRRPVAVIALAAATALLVVVAVVLGVMLSEASTRAADAESLADARGEAISDLEDDADDLEAELASAEEDLEDAEDRADTATSRASAAESQLSEIRAAGGGEAAFFRSIQRTAPAMAAAGQGSSLVLAQTMCDTLARNVSRDMIVATGTAFPTEQVRSFLSAAETYIC